MAIICPTITANEPHEYREQMERISGLSENIHIDVMDGVFTKTKSPTIEQLWWPHEVTADIHVMYMRPMEWVSQLVKLQPKMVIIHFETDVDHMHFAAEMHKEGINAGLAILQETSISDIRNVIDSFDQILIFSGNLGFHGGTSDLNLLSKATQIRKLNEHIEIAWDGGIDEHNVHELVSHGVQVLNVGSYLHKSDNPADAYAKLKQQI